MPKVIHIPGIIPTLHTTHIHPEFGLTEPIEFDKGTQSLEYPYVWNPGETLSFTYTLDEEPMEVFVDEVYRYGDNTEPPSAPFSELLAGKGSITLTNKNIAMLKNGSQYRLFNEDPTDEFSQGVSISREYGEKIQPGEVLYGHSTTVTSHILHQDAVGKKIVLVGYTLDGKNVTVTYKSEETSPFTLRPFMTLEPFPVISTGPIFNRHDHLAVSVSGNKIYMCGTHFGSIDKKTQLIIYDKDTYEYNPLFVNTDVIDPLLSDSSKEPYVRGFSVDGDYLALVCEGSEPQYDILLYKISTDEWSNKNNSILAANHYIRETSITLGKKPLDIKYLESTGNVHGMFTCFEGNFKPKIIYSSSNLETWTTIFDESKLTSSVNSNIYGPITLTGAAQCISKSTLSKIIDEDTMFSEFCSYATNNLFIDPAPMVYGYNAQFLIKTTDRGTTWTDVMDGHPEYSFSGTVRNHISDDGQKIYSMIFYKEKSGVTGLTVPTFPYADNTVLFNYSSDGGTTWTYPTGGWSQIASPGEAAYDYFRITNGLNVSKTFEEQHLTHKTMLYSHTDNDIVAVFRNADGVMVHKISRDGGATWVTGYGEIYGNKSSASILQGDLVGDFLSEYEPAGAISMEPFDANDIFGAYVGYHGAVDEVDNTDKYSVSDFIFASLGGGYGGYGGNYSEDKIMDSYIYIPTTNTSSKISKLKGYYI